MKNIPNEAYHFKINPVPIITSMETKKRQFAGVAYSGGMIKGHGYWDAVIFDLSTTKAANDKIPVLIEHDRDQRAGFASLDIMPDKIEVKDGILLNNEHGKAVALESDEGFPWQLSIHIKPGRIEELQAGSSTIVNGQAITGSAVIFRDNMIREVSFTPTGADHQTHAQAFSASNQNLNQGEIGKMDELKQLKDEIEGLKASVAASEGKATAAETRAQAAEGLLVQKEKEQRFSILKEVLDANLTEQAAAPYMAMDAITFGAVIADLKKFKAALPAALFAAQATSGKSSATDEVAANLAAYKVMFGKKEVK